MHWCQQSDNIIYDNISVTPAKYFHLWYWNCILLTIEICIQILMLNAEFLFVIENFYKAALVLSFSFSFSALLPWLHASQWRCLVKSCYNKNSIFQDFKMSNLLALFLFSFFHLHSFRWPMQVWIISGWVEKEMKTLRFQRMGGSSWTGPWTGLETTIILSR